MPITYNKSKTWITQMISTFIYSKYIRALTLTIFSPTTQQLASNISTIPFSTTLQTQPLSPLHSSFWSTTTSNRNKATSSNSPLPICYTNIRKVIPKWTTKSISLTFISPPILSKPLFMIFWATQRKGTQQAFNFWLTTTKTSSALPLFILKVKFMWTTSSPHSPFFF